MRFLLVDGRMVLCLALACDKHKTDGLRLDGYRSLTFHVQQSNDSSAETRAGEGGINFLLSFSYVTVAGSASSVPLWKLFLGGAGTHGHGLSQRQRRDIG